MDSKYVENLEDWIKAKGMKKPDANVAAFLAVRDLVKARLDDGYSATTIHEFLRDGKQIDICYDTFLKYVHRYVQPARKTKTAARRSLQLGTAASAIANADKKQSSTTSGIPGFTFNPIPDVKNLI